MGLIMSLNIEKYEHSPGIARGAGIKVEYSLVIGKKCVICDIAMCVKGITK